jgi:REP element-mobilizing transposase RayT
MTNPTTHRGWHSRGYLPHFDGSDVIQSITYRLHDALPVEVVEALKQDDRLQDDATKRQQLETLLDAGYGACYLREEHIATLVEENWKHFDNQRYRLLAWVVMPNHVHVLIRILEGFPLDRIIKSWKSYTALEANKLLNRNGRFWYPDYFDRFIRDQNHFGAVVRYIHNNPVKAGLVDSPELWPFSSAKLWQQ